MTDDPARQLALRYARIMDDRCFDELDEIMVDDVFISAPNFENRGLAAFKKQVQLLHNFSATMHLVANHYGEWEGDRYEGETYCVATHVYEKDGVGRNWEVGIRYKDSIVRVDGACKYTRRYLDVLWESDRPLKQ